MLFISIREKEGRETQRKTSRLNIWGEKEERAFPTTASLSHLGIKIVEI